MDHPAFQEGTFEHLKLGRAPVRRDARTLMLANYLVPENLPPIPGSADFTKGIVFPMYGNDRLGDCTIAAAGHMIQSWKHASGKKGKPSEATIEKAYWALGSQDDGRVELDVLNYWRNHGIGTDKISAYVALDPRNDKMLRAAIYLFGGVYIGVALPVTAQRQSLWSVVGDGHSGHSAPGSWGGHAVPLSAYDQATYTCVTWGATVKLTQGFNRTYTEEAYAILSPDWLTGGRSPAGFDLAALQSDLAALAH